MYYKLRGSMGEFEALQAQGWLWAYLGVFAAGFVTSLTPCVYPMIPIVLGIFGAKDTSRLKAFGLATLYVIGMGVTFAALGIVVFIGSFVLLDRLTPYRLWKEIIDDHNTALAILIGAIALGLSIIVAAAIH